MSATFRMELQVTCEAVTRQGDYEIPCAIEQIYDQADTPGVTTRRALLAVARRDGWSIPAVGAVLCPEHAPREEG